MINNKAFQGRARAHQMRLDASGGVWEAYLEGDHEGDARRRLGQRDGESFGLQTQCIRKLKHTTLKTQSNASDTDMITGRRMHKELGERGVRRQRCLRLSNNNGTTAAAHSDQKQGYHTQSTDHAD